MRKLTCKIENVVAVASLDHHLDLDFILKLSPTTTYRPERFHGLVYRLESPKTATLLFTSGKMICTGAKSERKAKRAIHQVINELKEKGIKIDKEPEVEIVNIVASIDLGGYIDLERSAESLEQTIYEPEQFPGLIYRMKKPKVVILLFTSGKTVCTQARKEEEVNVAGKLLQKTLESKNLISYK